MICGCIVYDNCSQKPLKVLKYNILKVLSDDNSYLQFPRRLLKINSHLMQEIYGWNWQRKDLYLAASYKWHDNNQIK